MLVLHRWHNSVVISVTLLQWSSYGFDTSELSLVIEALTPTPHLRLSETLPVASGEGVTPENTQTGGEKKQNTFGSKCGFVKILKSYKARREKGERKGEFAELQRWLKNKIYFSIQG